MRCTKSKYIIKEHPTYRMGILTVIIDGTFKKILKNNQGCFYINNCWPKTVTKKTKLAGKTKLRICIHNITHVDKPSHLYADHLNCVYENKLKKINNKKLQLTIIRDKDVNKKNIINTNRNGALFVIKNKINAGLELFTNKTINNIVCSKFKVLITDCLSVDPLDFPANSKKSNHYRLINKGIVIVERAPLSIIKNKYIKITREYFSTPQDDAEIINISPVK